MLNVGDGCAIWLYTGDGAHLRAAAVGHRNPRKAEWLRAELADPLPVTDDDLLAEAIRRRRMIVIDDVASGPARPEVHAGFSALAERTGLQALCVVPLAVDNAVLGAVVVGRDRSAGGFDIPDQALLAQVADWATLAMFNARLSADVRASQARFVRAFVNAPVGAALVDVEGNRFGRFLFVNDAYCRLTAAIRASSC
ncbi:MAG: GAF domain-containing protein [Frankiaceae bacterium]